MVQLTDIHPLSDFLRNHKDHVKRLRKAGRPEVLTINGKAELVVQDARSYQKMLEAIERAETIIGIRRGLRDVEAGRTKSADQVLSEMRRKLKISP